MIPTTLAASDHLSAEQFYRGHMRASEDWSTPLDTRERAVAMAEANPAGLDIWG
jgi:hypothetical protein